MTVVPPLDYWDALTAYPVGAVVRHAGAYWQATSAEPAGSEPGADPQWVRVDVTVVVPVPFTFPVVDPARLRSRLDLPATPVTDATLSECIDTARAILDPRCDPARFPAAAPAYVEGVTQLAVKVYETGPRGLGNLTPDAGWEALTAQATSGFYKAVLGVIAPALRTGGIVIA